ncbi:MAG: aromatic amino acid ammonia-lyase [Pseudomonadota bacterium]
MRPNFKHTNAAKSPETRASGAESGAEFDFTHDLSIHTAGAIVDGRMQVAPSYEIWARCEASHRVLRRCIDEARHVYGITTGFGPLANRLVDPSDAVTLQQNLVHHLASGLGDPLDWASARAVCLARLSSIMKGYSGASRQLIEALVKLLNSELAPVVPERGTVGASGDLTPLAHIVLSLQGRGAFMDRSGAHLNGGAALVQLGLKPLDLGNRDGLALVNGTSAMTGIAVQNALAAERCVSWSLALSAALLEVLQGRAEAWSPVLAEIRPHGGQHRATMELNQRLDASDPGLHGRLSDRRLTAYNLEDQVGQDAYTLRCAPQVIGGVVDAVTWHRTIIEQELNSVSDNPVFPNHEEALAIHGGNFMGQHVALASDTLAMSVVVLAGFTERQIARLTDEKLNGDLPAFLHLGTPGLNSGFMGAQVTATATVAEMRAVGPASIHSISTNGANQDVVSMGTISSRQAQRQLAHCCDVIAILALCVAQAVDIRHQTKTPNLSPACRALYNQIREVSVRVDTDRPLSSEIADVSTLIRACEPRGP